MICFHAFFADPKLLMMNTVQLRSLQISFIVVLTAICQHGYSQKATTWRGGTPGMANNWYCPQNWSTCSVPDEFSDVIIPDVSRSTFTTPELLSGTVEVNSICIHQNSSLTISKEATLIILGHAEGISSNSVTGKGEMICQSEILGYKKKMLSAH